MVMVFLHGGASHLDTFDPKEDPDTRGEFRAIKTSVSGLQISEHLPGLGERIDDLALIRSMTSKEGNHNRARYLMHTGFVPQGGVVHPAWGSVISSKREMRALPNYVAINGPGHGAGYLGAAHAAFTVGKASKPVANLAPPREVSERRRDRRLDMWRALEASDSSQSVQREGQRAVTEQGISLIGSPDVAAFDLDEESASTRARYGQDDFGMGCLMARRLLEHDVPFVEVGLRGWDTHQDNFNRVRDLSRTLDGGLSALIDDLQANGMWSDTLLVCMGDFGRTPRINDRGGRDHYPRVSSLLLGGGAISPGVVGASSSDGAEIESRPVRPQDLFATLAKTLGVAADEMHMTPGGRPVTTVEQDGVPIEELLRRA